MIANIFPQLTMYTGFVLEARQSEEADRLSYEDMDAVGVIRLADTPRAQGDDLDDSPFDANGQIYNGNPVQLRKGDFVIVVRGISQEPAE